jgi:hypothetical protein
MVVLMKQAMKYTFALAAVLFLLTMVRIEETRAQLFPNLGGQRVGISAFQFLKIGVGARAVGIGESFVAVANDASALYWNPAGLAQFSDNQVLFAHTDYLVDLKHEFFGGVYHLSANDAVGISVTELRTDDMEVTTETQPFGTGTYFSYRDLAFGLSYGRKMTDQFSFGITTRYVTETLGILKMNGLMVDMGTYYWTGLGSSRFAVVISNFGPDVSPQGNVTLTNHNTVDSFQPFAPPTQFKVGFAMEPYQVEDQKLTTSIELQHPNDNAENFRIGAEYEWNQTLWLRAGVKRTIGESLFGKDLTSANDFSFGVGFGVPVGYMRLHVDYAYANFDLLGDVHRISINLGL